MNIRKAKRIANHLKLLIACKRMHDFSNNHSLRVISGAGTPPEFYSVEHLNKHINRTKENLRRALS